VFEIANGVKALLNFVETTDGAIISSLENTPSWCTLEGLITFAIAPLSRLLEFAVQSGHLRKTLQAPKIYEAG